jgi:hypothetical protein
VGKTHIDNLEAGMVLTEDVYDRGGRLLLGAGVELQHKHLMIFRTWGVCEASVDKDSPDEVSSAASVDIDPEDVVLMEQRLKPRFRYADLTHPAMQELLRLSALQRIHHGLS